MDIRGRASFLRDILKFQGWKWVFAFPFAAFGGLQALRDEFLLPDDRQRYRLLNLLPDWPWEWWALITLAVVCILLFEGAYRANLGNWDNAVQERGPFPDMGVWDMFKYIAEESEFSEQFGDLEWSELIDRIGQDVLDRANVGQLQFWGRFYDPNWGAFFGKKRLTEVDRKYWEDSSFTYQFMDGWPENCPHSFPGPGKHELRDLRVNRAQVEEIWPRKR